MKENYPACEKRVLAYEGGYTNEATDPGGPTNYGITIADARMYWKPSATASDVRNMPLSVAQDIYKSKYWDKVRGDDLPSGLDETVFDYGVNSGVGRSGKVLRRVMGLDDSSSVVTDAVLGEVAKRDSKALIVAINDERLRFLQSLKIWPTYGKGWSRRVADCKSFSLSLASGATTATQPEASPGKGTVKKPEVTKSVVTTGGGAGTAVAGASFSDWIVAHPVAAIAIAAGIVAAIVAVITLINRRHRSKQEGPSPGVTPVVPTGEPANVGQSS